jgi:ABC-2 type transport system permease protein
VSINLVGAAFGVLSKPNEEKSSTAPVFAILMQICFFVCIIVGQNPNTLLARVTSYTPPISAPIMISRLGTGEITSADVLGPFAVLLLSIAVALWISVRLMTMCLQLDGIRLNPATLLRRRFFPVTMKTKY